MPGNHHDSRQIYCSFHEKPARKPLLHEQTLWSREVVFLTETRHALCLLNKPPRSAAPSALPDGTARTMESTMKQRRASMLLVAATLAVAMAAGGAALAQTTVTISMTAPPATPRLNGPFVFGSTPATPLAVRHPGNRTGAADVRRVGAARRAHARSVHGHHHGNDARRRLPRLYRHRHERRGQRERHVHVDGRRHARAHAANGLEQLRLVRRERHRAGHARAGRRGEGTSPTVRLEPRRHRLSLVRERAADRRERPLPARTRQSIRPRRAAMVSGALPIKSTRRV